MGSHTPLAVDGDPLEGRASLFALCIAPAGPVPPDSGGLPPVFFFFFLLTTRSFSFPFYFFFCVVFCFPTLSPAAGPSSQDIVFFWWSYLLGGKARGLLLTFKFLPPATPDRTLIPFTRDLPKAPPFFPLVLPEGPR